MNSLTLHQTSECQYSASILRRRHKSENVVKFCYFDMTLLCKVYIIQLLRTLYFWKINFNYYQKLSHAFFWAELPLSARVGHLFWGFLNTYFCTYIIPSNIRQNESLGFVVPLTLHGKSWINIM